MRHSNYIPTSAVAQSEALRNPAGVQRTERPIRVAPKAPVADPFGEDRVSPDQPSFEEARSEKHDAKVPGG